MDCIDRPSFTGFAMIPDGSWAMKMDEITSCKSDRTPPVKSYIISIIPFSPYEETVGDLPRQAWPLKIPPSSSVAN